MNGTALSGSQLACFYFVFTVFTTVGFGVLHHVTTLSLPIQATQYDRYWYILYVFVKDPWDVWQIENHPLPKHDTVAFLFGADA